MPIELTSAGQVAIAPNQFGFRPTTIKGGPSRLFPLLDALRAHISHGCWNHSEVSGWVSHRAPPDGQRSQQDHEPASAMGGDRPLTWGVSRVSDMPSHEKTPAHGREFPGSLDRISQSLTRSPSQLEEPLHTPIRAGQADRQMPTVHSPENPGGCFGHCSNIQAPGFRTLSPGQQVRSRWEAPGLAGRIRLPGGAHRSSLRLTSTADINEAGRTCNATLLPGRPWAVQGHPASTDNDRSPRQLNWSEPWASSGPLVSGSGDQ